MRKNKYHIYLSEEEYNQIISSLITLKNSLIAQGKFTDGVDDVLFKALKARKKRLKIEYVQKN